MTFYKKIFKYSLTFFCMLCINLSFAATEQPLDTIVTTVNNSVITQSELNQAIQATTEALQATHQTIPNKENLTKTVLNQLIDRKLQLQLAHDSGVSVTPAELKQAIAHIADQNHLSIEQLYRTMATHGLTKQAYEKKLNEEILLQKMQQQAVSSKISMTPDEIRTFIEQNGAKTPPIISYHVKDFQIALPDTPTPTQLAQAKEQAAQLLQQLRQNKNPISIPHTEMDLGTLTLTEMPSAFATALAHVTQPAFINPIQTGNGFHILHLINRTVTATPTLSTQEAEQALFEQKYEKAVKQWLNLIRSQATIHIHLDNA